jgi:hypothetical protein
MEGSSMNARKVDEALIRRIEAAVAVASVQRSAVEFDWPECHKRGCQGRHGDVDSAFGTMKIQVMRAVRAELQYELTTRPDIADEDDTPEQSAVYTLAMLLHRYNVHDAGTFVKAAQLIVDAYPGLVPALTESEVAA